MKNYQLSRIDDYNLLMSFVITTFVGNPMIDEFSDLPPFEQYKKRILKSFNYYQKFVQEPSFDKLLPDPLKVNNIEILIDHFFTSPNLIVFLQYPYVQPKYTLVLEMVRNIFNLLLSTFIILSRTIIHPFFKFAERCACAPR